jgi:alkylation response protein AidB-like acyl-CoA dehydrogenase
MGRQTLQEFTAEAREFLSLHASARGGTAFAWGSGDDVIPFFDDEKTDENAAIEAAKSWAQCRFDAGFGWITGPEEYGGRALPPAYELQYRLLESQYDLPDTGHLELGWGMVGPTVLAHGPQHMKDAILRPLYRGEFVACQLFSEPEAGSDLAGVRTTAVPDGDEWLVNGQKVWTSDAHHSKWGLLLTRTNPDVPKHKGLTMFLVDMHAPGVQVRPLRQMTGGAHFNEVFFEDTRVPDSARVGEVDGGWRVALTTLMNERGSVGAGPPATMAALDTQRLVGLVRHLGLEGDPLARQGLAQMHIQFAVGRAVAALAREKALEGEEPGPEGSVLKLLLSKNLNDVASWATDLLGPAATADTGEWGTFVWSDFLLGTPAMRILGGTEEIMKNILGERVLGLPKEPAATPS